MRRVVCAANRFEKVIVVGPRHYDMTMHRQIEKYRFVGVISNRECPEQGFIDQHGVFMDRKEALEVALAAGQILDIKKKCHPTNELFSEDIY
jgi:hypothetical protein